MHLPNDDVRPPSPDAAEPVFDGAESVWDPVLIRLFLETLAGKQRLLLD